MTTQDTAQLYRVFSTSRLKFLKLKKIQIKKLKINMSTKSQKKFGDKETTLDVIKSLMFSNAQKNKTFYNIWMGVVFVHVVF